MEDNDYNNNNNKRNDRTKTTTNERSRKASAREYSTDIPSHYDHLMCISVAQHLELMYSSTGIHEIQEWRG